MKSAQSHAKTYDSVAAEYQERMKKQRQIKKETTQVLLDYLQPGERVLDLGCAVGYDTLMLARKCQVTGLDISPEMVKKARHQNRRNKRTRILLGDFVSMSFKEKFGGIFANAFLHLFPTGEYEKVLAKMRRVLRDGGFAYISTTRSKRSKEGWFRKKDYKSQEKRFRKYWTKREMTHALEVAGFHIVKYFENIDPFGKHFMYFIVQK
jgi:ubiquinone/menaquinone biosynthesis C-methylase UbiE